MNAVLLFSIEGFLLQFTGSINNFGNNLFATNLGATDRQIGLIQTIPNLVAVLLLIPIGLWADRAKNVRMVPVVMLGAMTLGYLLLSGVPFATGLRIPLFFFALVFTIGGTVLYNTQWQNFFGEVVEQQKRNYVLTYRNRFMFIVGILAPLMFGGLLNFCNSAESKTRVFQAVFFLCALASGALILVLSRIQVKGRETAKHDLTVGEIKETIIKLSHDKNFMLFFIPIVFFYITWQMDWTMWYIGQTQYLGLNEGDLSVYNAIFNIGQLVAIGFFSKMVWKKGADYSICYAAIGLILCPVAVLLTEKTPVAWHLPVLTLLVTVFNAGQCTVNLCIVQILLRVSPKECRSLAISLYTLMITLSNSVVPYVGVCIYTALGADHHAFVLFFVFAILIRLLSFFGLSGRYLFLKKRTGDTMMLS